MFDNGAFRSPPILGFVTDVTSPKLKLHGIAACLECLRQPSTIALVTDEEYIRNCVNGLIGHWSRNGWRTKDGNPIANQPEIERLAQLLGVHNVTATVPVDKAELEFHASLVFMARDHARLCGSETRSPFCPELPL